MKLGWRRGGLLPIAGKRLIEQLPLIGAGAALVSIAGGILYSAGVSLEFADVALLLVVVGASLLGYSAGVAAAVTGFVVLLYGFVPPVGELVIRNVEDFLVLIANLVAATLVAFVVARLNVLRRRSTQSAREAQLRLELTRQLLHGATAEELMSQIAREIILVFDLVSCGLVADDVTVGSDAPTASSGGPETSGLEVLEARSGALCLTAQLRRHLSEEERSTIEALVATLSVVLDRLRLEGETRRQQVNTDLAQSRAGFLTAVTHDVRTPLATIKAASAALLMPGSQLSEQERRELLETIYDESSDLDRLISKVLELTRLRAGRVVLQRTSVTPAELAVAAIARAHATAPAREFVLDVSEEHAAIDVDPVLIGHAIGNLLENAMMYSPVDQVLTVATRRTPNRLELRIIDRGPGVPVEARERMFDEFVRLVPDDHRGMGLGLAIVTGLVAAHDGEVWYEDTPGGGATFVIALPVTVTEEQG